MATLEVILLISVFCLLHYSPYHRIDGKTIVNKSGSPAWIFQIFSYVQPSHEAIGHREVTKNHKYLIVQKYESVEGQHDVLQYYQYALS